MAVRTALKRLIDERRTPDGEKVSQADVARSTGIRADRLSRLASGDAVPTWAEVETLAQELSVVPEHIWSDALLSEIRAAEAVS